METSIQKEILQNESRYWEAMGNNDVEGAISLTRFPCTISGPQGFRQVSQDEYRRLMESHDGSRYKQVKIENPRVEVMNDESAVIVYSVQVNGMKMLDTSLWVKNAGRWVCGYHSEFPEQLH